jgi:hypothetical protein
MHVKGHLKRWFEERAPRSMHTSIEEGMQRAWTEGVIQPLEKALGTALPKNDLFAKVREFA